MMKHLAIFASGTGSNFDAIADAIDQGELRATISLLVCDRPNAMVIQKAKERGITTFCFRPKDYQSKSDYEKLIVEKLEFYQTDLVVLAGYMRLIGTELLSAYEGKIINIHPSLLPNFKGKDAVGQAIASKATETGVTVHYVDSGMDTGKVIEQVALDISNMNGRDEIETEIHKIEHRLYKKVIKQLLEDIK